jgi:hypothetical protein
MAYIYTSVKEAISQEAKRFECISRRYELPYCILLLWSEAHEDVSGTIMANIRCADHFVKIDENLYALIFFANRPDAYSKVANKLMYALEKSYPKKKFSIGVACTDNMEASDVIMRAVQNLLSAKEHEFNTIEDNF